MKIGRRIIISLFLCVTMLLTSTPNKNICMTSYAENSDVVVAQVSCGSGHTGILVSDGSLRMTGNNWSGALGDGTDEDKLTPVKIMDGVAQVSCGNYHTGILKKDGSLWMTGFNSGQLGDGTGVSTLTPVKIMDGVAQVSCGNYHTGIIKKDGSLWMTGGNEFGQLGDGTTESKLTPVKIMDGVAQVSCDAQGDYTGILKKDGSLWMTGANGDGQLGDGVFGGIESKRTIPIKIMDNVVQVSCGSNHTGIIKKDGSLWMTGYNYNGQLGDGTTNKVSTPKRIMSEVEQVICGSGMTSIIKKDGSLWMTGYNGGRFGDGSYESKSTPVKIMGGVAQVSVGGVHTGILKKDGSLWMTGENRQGQLGDGTTEEKSTPVQIKLDEGSAPKDPVTEKYVIGKDTWNFRNYSEGASIKDYEKIYPLIKAHWLKTTESVDEALGRGTLARCFGMSTLIPSIKEYGFPENLCRGDIHSLKQNSETRQWLRYYQVAQTLPTLVKEEKLNTNDYNGLYEAVKDSFEGKGEPVVIAQLGSYHEVLPVSILKDTDEEVWINIYDPIFPDNLDDEGKPIYETLVLYGKNGNYSNSKWFLSRQIGPKNYIANSTEDISYSTSVQSIISAYESNSKSNDYKLAKIKNGTRATITGVIGQYPINLKNGNDTVGESTLYWLEDNDNKVTVENIESGNEIIIASDNNSISIKPFNDSNVKITVDDNNAEANIAMDNPGSVEIKCLTGDKEVREVTATVDADTDSSFSLLGGEIKTEGISSINIKAATGEFNEDGKISGTEEEFSQKSIDSSATFTFNVDDMLGRGDVIDCSLSHSYGPWKTVKTATYASAGTKERVCNACGNKEQVSIPKLARTSIAKSSVTKITNKTYTGKKLTQAPVVKVGNKTLKKGTDYKLTYKNNKKIGKAIVVITGIGGYTGTVNKTFLINPKGTSLSKLTATKKGFTAKWKKQATHTTGYQIQYSTNKKFKSGNKTVTVGNNKTISKKIAKLKAKKKYFVRVRTYKTVSGKKYYSGWSKSKVVTTKK